jgi:hypothetical protein
MMGSQTAQLAPRTTGERDDRVDEDIVNNEEGNET